MGDGALGSAVQLLTPEGERVHHPVYDITLGDAELRGLYRDMVLVRRIDAEATALQRQGELGLWASSLRPGGGAGRIGPESGPARLRLPDVPRPRSDVEPGRAAARDPGDVPRSDYGRLGSERAGVRDLHDRDRQPGVARRRLRDGHPVGWRPTTRSSRTSATGRPPRATSTRRCVRCGLQRAGGVLLPEQPVGDLAAAGSQQAASRSRTCRRVRLPGRAGRRQRHPGRIAVTREALEQRPLRRAGRRRRGVHLSHGRPHDIRRSDPLPPRGAISRSGASAIRSSG